MTGLEYRRRDLIRAIEGEIARASGRRYHIAFEALDVDSLTALLRLLRDLDGERRRAVQQAIRMPWRYPS